MAITLLPASSAKAYPDKFGKTLLNNKDNQKAKISHGKKNILPGNHLITIKT
ncbi:hypothetical protein L0337_15795 [candidate division KSB1 bacterium]|nr:hypothetical protein [candidate division KSB1 bacterium]